MFRRRRRMKKLVRVARVMRELDSAAAYARAEPRRIQRVAVGRL